MDLTKMTHAQRIAWHRSEADRIEAEERARRPALAAGQVWRWGVRDYIATRYPDSEVVHLYSIYDASIWARDGGFGGEPFLFEYVGLARDVLRVVPPDPPAPQVAPEPTRKRIDS